MNDIAYRLRRCRSLRHPDDGLDEVLVGRERDGVDAGSPERVAQGRLAPVRGLSEPPPEALVVRVDVELLAGLGVLHEQRPDVRQLDLAPVEQADGKHLVALGEQVQRPLPARRADEVRDHEDEGAALDRVLAGLEERRQVGERRLRQAAAAASRSLMRRRTWIRPPRAGIVRSTRLP